MNYIGIDNGLDGGIVILNDQMKILYKCVMPVLGSSKREYDMITIANVLRKYPGAQVVLERAQPHFRDGKKQLFKTGHGFGIIQGILTALQLQYIIVAPKDWQKQVFKGLNTDDTKLASALFCQQKWPTEDWRRSDKATKLHDGMTDAACMAYYGINGNV